MCVLVSIFQGTIWKSFIQNYGSKICWGKNLQIQKMKPSIEYVTFKQKGSSFLAKSEPSSFFMPPKSKANPTAEILAFLLEKNRPYSSTNLVDEMHGEYTKGVIQKSLDSLVESDKITCKLCGKTSKLYFAKQDDKQVASKEELVEMDHHNEELSKKLEELKKKRDELRAQRDLLASKRTIDDLRSYRKQIEEKVEKETQRKDDLIAASEGITPEDSVNAEKSFNERCMAWHKRKRLCKEIIDTLSEGMDKKPKVIMEELELETDEQYHVNLEYKDKKFKVIDV